MKCATRASVVTAIVALTGCTTGRMDEGANVDDANTDAGSVASDGDVGEATFDAAPGDAEGTTDAEDVPDVDMPPGDEPVDASSDAPADAGDASDWPALANGELPFGNVFYGNPYHGDHTGNGKLFKYEASRRFRAERTGSVTAFRYNNRTLLNANISDRCTAGNIWCECLDNGLDAYTCGYHLGNSYSLGNGGSLVVQIREDDGTAAHLPSSKVLGETKTAFVPKDHEGETYPTLEFAAPIPLVAGRVYHLVYQQKNPPTKCTATGGLSVTAAKACDRDKGLVGINGVYTWKPPTPHGGPYFGETAALLTRQSATGTWSLDRNVKPWYEVRYTDGVWVGDVVAAYDAATGARKIAGALQVRERFTVRDVSRNVTGAWFRIARLSAASAGDLTLTLKQEGASAALATAVIPAADVSLGTWDGGTYFDVYGSNTIAWVYVSFGKTIPLVLGKTYTAVFSAPAGAHYVASTTFELSSGAFDSLSRNFFLDAGAQISEDGGATWKAFASTYPGRDLSLVFTLEGMPKQMP